MLDYPQYLQLQSLYQDYAAVVDAADWDRWCNFFVDDCSYRVQARENFDRGLPLATLALESKGMLKDRIYAITETIFHDPYYQRHLVAAPRVLGTSKDLIDAEANYAVFRTKRDGISEVYNVGRYIDRIRVKSGSLLFESRICVFDSETILNSLIYPI